MPLSSQSSLALAESVAPLCDVNYARTRLRLDHEAVMDLLENGRLRWAWNIGTANARQREIRILTDCVERAVNKDYSHRRETIDDVVKRILPQPTETECAGQRWKTIRAVVLTARLVCHPSHISHLVEQNEIFTTPMPHARFQSPYLEFDSVVAFLKRRELSKLSKR